MKSSIDIRLQQLSYSSRLTLHSCPRKFQLDRLNATVQETEEDIPGSVTFSFGHAVGIGVQSLFVTGSLDTAIWDTFLGWDVDLLADNPRQKKSIWLAISAIQKLDSLRESGFLSDYEVLTYQGKPAIELSFLITFPKDFKYRGFADAVLRHKGTGEILVLECKTTSATSVAPAMYKNSAQAVGYSVVLDAVVGDLSSYKVQYLVYKTKSEEWEALPFMKDYLARALWLAELSLDIEFISRCDEAGVFPMHGESCYDLFRECPYFGVCTLSTDSLVTSLTQEEIDSVRKSHSDFQIQVTFEELIKSQLEKE